MLKKIFLFSFIVGCMAFCFSGCGPETAVGPAATTELPQVETEVNPENTIPGTEKSET